MTRTLTAAALLAALAAPAAQAQTEAQAPGATQAPFCGGISLVGEWVGGDAAASDVSEAPALFEQDGTVPIAGHLVRMFTLSRTTDIRIDVAAIPAGDPYVSLYDASGAEVATDDDSGGGFASRVLATLGAGTYCLAARSYESGVTEVAVKVGRPEQAFAEEAAPVPEAVEPPARTGAGCFEPGTPVLAEGVTMQTIAEGALARGSAAAIPALAFSLAEPVTLSVTARSETGDPLIRLLDGKESILAENDDFEGLDSRIDMTEPLPAGRYCIELEDLNGSDDPIDVALEAFDPGADRLRRLNAAEFAPTEADAVETTDLGPLETEFLRQVTAGADASWFAFTLPEGGLLVAEAIGDGSDPSLVLFDRVGRRVAENDDGPQGLDSFLVTRLFPGSYTLALRLVDDGGRGDVRLLMERYVPAE